MGLDINVVVTIPCSKVHAIGFSANVFFWLAAVLTRQQVSFRRTRCDMRTKNRDAMSQQRGCSPFAEAKSRTVESGVWSLPRCLCRQHTHDHYHGFRFQPETDPNRIRALSSATSFPCNVVRCSDGLAGGPTAFRPHCAFPWSRSDWERCRSGVSRICRRTGRPTLRPARTFFKMFALFFSVSSRPVKEKKLTSLLIWNISRERCRA